MTTRALWRSATPLPAPQGPTAVDRVRKAVVDAGSDLTVVTLPLSVAVGVLAELDQAVSARDAAQDDARAARETTRAARERANRAEEVVAQMQGKLKARGNAREATT